MTRNLTTEDSLLQSLRKGHSQCQNSEEHIGEEDQLMGDSAL